MADVFGRVQDLVTAAKAQAEGLEPQGGGRGSGVD
jgi:hypothetical protein